MKLSGNRFRFWVMSSVVFYAAAATAAMLSFDMQAKERSPDARNPGKDSAASSPRSKGPDGEQPASHASDGVVVEDWNLSGPSVLDQVDVNGRWVTTNAAAELRMEFLLSTYDDWNEPIDGFTSAEDESYSETLAGQAYHDNRFDAYDIYRIRVHDRDPDAESRRDTSF